MIDGWPCANPYIEGPYPLRTSMQKVLLYEAVY